MKNWDHLFAATSAVLLIGGAAFAQGVSSPLPSMKSSDPPPTTLQEVLARTPFHFPANLVEQMKEIDGSAALAQKGDHEANQGNTSLAVSDYQQALALWPYEQEALYGVADDSLKRGDVAGAVGYYRQAIYTRPDPPTLPIFHENNVFRLMEYALLLSQTGQQAEALTVYRHGAALFNVMDGRPRHKVALPDLGDQAGAGAFHAPGIAGDGARRLGRGPLRLRRQRRGGALAAGGGARPGLRRLVYYYRARYEARHVRDYKAVKADFDPAAELGGSDVGDAVQQEEHFFRHEIAAAPQTKISQ